MLFWLESLLHDVWGPFRLLASHALMISCGALFGGLAVWLGIPRMWHLLPCDRGRAHTPTAQAAPVISWKPRTTALPLNSEGA